ncbi:MAG: hypothetical protein GYA41_12255 [Bacteroidales bacterium]|nr:hypothetical protein [Bacteroidales bacterium]
MNSRLSFYSTEVNYEMLLMVPPSYRGVSLNVILKIGGKAVAGWKGSAGKNPVRIAFNADLPPSGHIVTAEISGQGITKQVVTAPLSILIHKTNEVKSDRLTGSLIVGGRIFFPYGFYCYSPVQNTLPEEEVVKGFNMMSPYQKLLPETLGEREKYMDRCADLGMKVHYNLISLTGGGGASSQVLGLSWEEKTERLIAEIRTFMDHPALLAWYIADEPNGLRIPPSDLEEIYKIIKQTDPWHPVSMVFMTPFLSSRNYEDALDIVIADPYPVPNRPVTQTGIAASQLVSEFRGRKSVWIVPQAFGGGEWWSREPSIQEIRSMTYQAVVEGASGIQFFIRHGLNSFPKSTAMWNECGRMALEIAEIIPWLLSDDDTIAISCSSGNISVRSAVHDGKLLIIAVNKANLPQQADFRISGAQGGSVSVIFENRKIQLSGGSYSDCLSAFGSQAYIYSTGRNISTIQPYIGNLVTDPGFEDTSSPGVPASAYAWNEGDKGATFFIDSREHFEGDHSLRLVTPSENGGVRLRFFPVRISKGKTYMLSIRAKADDESGSPENQKNRPRFELSLGEFGGKTFIPGKDWQHFVTSVSIPHDTIASPRVNAILRMPGKGTAWFDMLQVFEAVDIGKSVNPETKEKGLLEFDPD